jgi:hypothetical protein
VWLLRVRGGLAERGRRLVVAKTARPARRVFELTGLLGVFQPDADPEQA